MNAISGDKEGKLKKIIEWCYRHPIWSITGLFLVVFSIVRLF